MPTNNLTASARIMGDKDRGNPVERPYQTEAELIEKMARAVSIADHKRVPDGFADAYPADDLSDWDVWIATAVLNTLRETLVPVNYWHKVHCADWYEGAPDHEDGRGPYETRTLYALPQEEKP